MDDLLSQSYSIIRINAMRHRRFVIDVKKKPDIPGMMLVTLEALETLGGSATIQEIDEKVIELEGVTEKEQTFAMPGKKANLSRVNYYLAWARTYLKRGNAMVNSSRGVWALTETGAAITTIRETRAIYDQATREDIEKQRIRQRAAKEKNGIRVDPKDDDLNEGEDWKSILLSVLGDMPPDAFERLSQRLLREAGFTKVEVRGKSGDGGIDGVGVLRVNLISFQIYFQCKRWKGSVGSKEIRDFRGALQGRADKGIFITTGYFTSQASDEATRDGAIAIDLVDGDRLCDLLKDNGLGVETRMVEDVQILSDWFRAV